MAPRTPLHRLRLALAVQHHPPPAHLPTLAGPLMTRPTVDPETIATLAARHLVVDDVDEDGEHFLWIEDGATAVMVTHDIGDPEAAAQALIRLADTARAHAEQIRYRHRMRTAGWT